MPLQKEIKKIEEVVPLKRMPLQRIQEEAKRVHELAIQQRGVKGTLESTWLGNRRIDSVRNLTRKSANWMIRSLAGK